jgi:hypothetical protein
MPTRKDILASRYTFRTLVHDTMMKYSLVEDPYGGPLPTTIVTLVNEKD